MLGSKLKRYSIRLQGSDSQTYSSGNDESLFFGNHESYFSATMNGVIERS